MNFPKFISKNDDRHWDEFNETKTMAQMPTAKIFRKRNVPIDSNEDVDSSEILIPESLTDFTSNEEEGERQRPNLQFTDVIVHCCQYQ